MTELPYGEIKVRVRVRESKRGGYLIGQDERCPRLVSAPSLPVALDRWRDAYIDTGRFHVTRRKTRTGYTFSCFPRRDEL